MYSVLERAVAPHSDARTRAIRSFGSTSDGGRAITNRPRIRLSALDANSGRHWRPLPTSRMTKGSIVTPPAPLPARVR